MSDLESSFQLLSTMSPKINRTKSNKVSSKSPHKLSLKKNFRRSSVFDKKPHSHLVLDSSVIVIDDSFSQGLNPNNVKVIKQPIIISSTSESDVTSVHSGENASDSDRKVASKHVDIDNWLSENEKLDGYSEIFSFKHNSFSESEDERFNSPKISRPRKTEDDGQASGSWHVVSIDSKLGKEPLRTPQRALSFTDKDEKENLNLSDTDVINDTITDFNKSAENILDDVYGTSWRENKDKILTRSEPRRQKKHSPVHLPQTERKPRNNPNIKNTDCESPWVRRFKHLCDSESSDESVNSASIRSVGDLSDNCRKLSDTEDEYESPLIMTPPTMKSRTISAKSNPISVRYAKKIHSGSSNSSTNEISFSESENDSLGTRVRKKLAKKAKELRNDKLDTKKVEDERKNDIARKKNTGVKKTENTTEKTTYNNRITAQKLFKTNSVSTKSESSSQKYSFLKSLSGCVPSWLCDTEAHFYKNNFKTNKSELAKKLFTLFNKQIFDNAIPADTPLQWNDRMRGTAGFCYNKRITKSNGTVLRSCRIELASKVLDSPDRLRDTLVHEMCHAATWLVNNVSDGHGPYWKSWASKAMQRFPELPAIKKCHDYQINTKYTYKCVDCGYSIGRHSKSLDVERKRCGYCYGKFDIFINKVTKNGEKQCAPATPKGKPTGFALFVKENYGSVKQPNLKHGDVMKILGQKFAALKIAKCSN